MVIEIDRLVRVGNSGPLPIGGFVDGRITVSNEHDLCGEMLTPGRLAQSRQKRSIWVESSVV